MEISIDQIRKLPAEQQLRLAEQIWDGLAASGQLVQQWHVDEGRRRSLELDADPSIAVSHAEMWDQVHKLRDD